MNFRRLFERKKPHIRVSLDGASYIVPMSEIRSVAEQVAIHSSECNGDVLQIDVVSMRPSDVAALPEFEGF